jgi:hypothetical protein
MFYKKDGAGCIAIQKRLLPVQAERKAAAGAKLELLEQRGPKMLASIWQSRDKSHNEVINHKLQHLSHWTQSAAHGDSQPLRRGQHGPGV